MTASELAFYTEGRPTVYCVNLGRRMNQYDIWQGFDKLVGQSAVYVTEGNMRPDLACTFDRAEPQTITIRSKSGQEIKTFVAYRCYNFKGWTPKSPTNY
jgi:hypothetical protein